MRGSAKPPTVAGVTLLAIASLGITGCQGARNPSAAGCASQAATAPAAAPAAAASWTLPGGNLQNTRDVASPITSSNVSQLGVAWCVPIESTTSSGYANGYATTPIVVNGVVYTQDLQSNVMAIQLATGKVLWTHDDDSSNGARTASMSSTEPCTPTRWSS